MIATPTGQGGRGGIDRMTDMTVDAIMAIPGINVTIERLVTRGQSNILLSPFVLGRALIRLFVATKRQEVDVVHICLSLKGSAYRKIIVAAVARFCGVPYVVHVHGGGFDYFWLTIGARLRVAVDRMFLASKKIVVLGRFWVGIFSGWLPETSHKIVVLPNATPGLGLANEPSEDGRVRVTFLGELGRRKGTPQLMKALSLLADRLDWKATLAGNGDIEATRARAQSLGLADRITIPGWLDSADTAQLMRGTDIIVLPTLIENLPMIIPEAFAYGIPVITTPVAAISEAIDHGRNGLLVPVGDIEALAEALRRLIEDSDLRHRLGQEARADHARSYEIRDYAMRLVRLWRDAAQ